MSSQHSFFYSWSAFCLLRWLCYLFWLSNREVVRRRLALLRQVMRP